MAGDLLHECDGAFPYHRDGYGVEIHTVASGARCCVGRIEEDLTPI